jgi:hypothetical protein
MNIMVLANCRQITVRLPLYNNKLWLQGIETPDWLA